MSQKKRVRFPAGLPNLPEESPRTGEDDVIRQWRETCDAVAVAGSTLGADPLQPDLLTDRLSDLSRRVDILTGLRDLVIQALNRSAPEDLLQRVDDVLAETAESGDSPITGWTHQIAARWRSAYPLAADTDVESLRADAERLEATLQHAIAAWQAACRNRAEVEKRHQEARLCAQQEADPRKRLDAEDREAELQLQLGRAAEKIQRARDHVFKTVAPADQVFDPRRDPSDPASPSEPPDPNPGSPPKPAATPAITAKATAEVAPHVVATAPPATQPPSDAPPPVDPTTSTSTEHPVDVKPPTTPQQPAELPDPPQRADRRQTAATDGLWRTLAGDRAGIAYHIARLGAERGSGSLTPLLADLIAATMLAHHVHSPDSESVRDLRPILERIDPAALSRDERRQTARDALHLLLFSATLRPALFAPTTGAQSLLRAVSLSDGLQPVYHLATRVGEHADRLLGVRLHASMFRSSQTGTWQQQYDALAVRVRAWHAGADSKRNIYGPATKVWRDLFARDGLLATLMKLISHADKSARPDVEAIHKQISDQKTFNQIVQRADRKGPKRNPIVGRALKQIWNDVQPAVEFSGQWLSLMDTRPETAGFIGERIEALRNDLQQHGRRAIDALHKAVSSSPNAVEFTATCPHAQKAVGELLQLSDRPPSLAESSLGANLILSRDLLYVADVEIDTALNPVATDVTRLLDLLRDTDAHADSMRTAFHARLERGDLIGARLTLDCLDGDDDVDACAASLAQRINDRRTALRSELQSAQKRLESAFCRGQLPADDRDGMAATLTALRQVVHSSSRAPLSLHDMEILTGSSRRLLDVDNAIEACGHKSIEAVRGRLRNVPQDRMDATARAVVDRTIEQGYVQTAHEQINRLESGESVEPPAPPEDPFSAFTSVLEAIETARETTDPQTILRAARAGERVAAVPFDELQQEEAQSAAGLLDAWYQMARKRSLDKVRLQSLLESLGLGVRTVNPQRPGSQATVTSEPIADRAVCPSRQFGSEANGRYRVVLNWEASGTDSVFRSVGIESRDPTIVLHFGRLGAGRDEIRKRATREHRLFLVVDETLVLFLAARVTIGCPLCFAARCPTAPLNRTRLPPVSYRRSYSTVGDASATPSWIGSAPASSTAGGSSARPLYSAKSRRTSAATTV